MQRAVGSCTPQGLVCCVPCVVVLLELSRWYCMLYVLARGLGLSTPGDDGVGKRWTHRAVLCLHATWYMLFCVQGDHGPCMHSCIRITDGMHHLQTAIVLEQTLSALAAAFVVRTHPSMRRGVARSTDQQACPFCSCLDTTASLQHMYIKCRDCPGHCHLLKSKGSLN